MRLCGTVKASAHKAAQRIATRRSFPARINPSERPTMPKPDDATNAGEPEPSRGRILIVDDEEVIASTLKEFLQGEKFEVAVAGDLASALVQVEAFEPEIVLCDVQLPGADGITVLNRTLQLRPETLFIMITAYATVENAVAAFQRGAHDYLMKPVLFDDLIVRIDRLVRLRRLLKENQALRRQLHAQGDLAALVGESPPIQAVKTLIKKVATSRTTVLVTGETGTGKELVARAVHAQGPAPEAAFLAINCAAIPHDLLENQLFGHVRGAYTGADRDQDGLFIAAGARHGLPRRDRRAFPLDPGRSCCGPSITRKSCPWARQGRFRFGLAS